MRRSHFCFDVILLGFFVFLSGCQTLPPQLAQSDVTLAHQALQVTGQLRFSIKDFYSRLDLVFAIDQDRQRLRIDFATITGQTVAVLWRTPASWVIYDVVGARAYQGTQSEILLAITKVPLFEQAAVVVGISAVFLNPALGFDKILPIGEVPNVQLKQNKHGGEIRFAKERWRVEFRPTAKEAVWPKLWSLEHKQDWIDIQWQPPKILKNEQQKYLEPQLPATVYVQPFSVRF